METYLFLMLLKNIEHVFVSFSCIIFDYVSIISYYLYKMRKKGRKKKMKSYQQEKTSFVTYQLKKSGMY